MIPQWLIEQKRDGGVLPEAELRAFMEGFAQGTIPDYQMAAMAMAIFFKGMTESEVVILTDAMMRSGDTLSFAGWPRPTADKHSTGGIGDKLSLMIAPLAASAGLAVPMISGRGLGITGGTLDKLESIPGYNTRLSTEAFKQVIEKVGCSIIGQTDRLAPADQKLYALRDVTGTVPSIPLITASIMSKKLAEGAETLVFDVKCGRAAFMRSREDARRLAESLSRVGRALNRKTAALITAMDQPLGRTVGNAVEVIEAVETLKGKGPSDTRELTLELTALMTVTAGLHHDRGGALLELKHHLDDGRALEVFRKMVVAQGGDPRFIDDPTALAQPSHRHWVTAPCTGYVSDVNALTIGRIVLQLGGGRTKTDDTIDPAAGVEALVQQGEHVEKGAPLMCLLGKNSALTGAHLAAAEAAVTLTPEKPAPRKLILESLGSSDQ